MSLLSKLEKKGFKLEENPDSPVVIIPCCSTLLINNNELTTIAPNIIINSLIPILLLLEGVSSW